jgi:hypothetical protein
MLALGHRARPRSSSAAIARRLRFRLVGAPAIRSGIITFSSAGELAQQVMKLEHEADRAVP